MRTFSYQFTYRADMLACKHGIDGYLVGVNADHAISYRNGLVVVSYASTKSLDRVLMTIARHFDSKEND